MHLSACEWPLINHTKVIIINLKDILSPNVIMTIFTSGVISEFLHNFKPATFRKELDMINIHQNSTFG